MITTADVRDAADILRPVFDATGGQDGRVSIEVDPRLAHNTTATIAEAKQLAWLVDRPNTLIKIPATKAGLPGDHRGHRPGHQRQRHADLLAGALPRGHGRLPGGPGEGQGRAAWTSRRSTPWRPSSCPAWTPRSTSGSTRSAPTRPRPPAARPASPTPVSPTRRTRRSSPRTAGPPLESARRQQAASAVGLHRRQGPGVQGHHVRRRTGRAEHGEHHAGGHPVRHRGPRRDHRQHHRRHLRAGPRRPRRGREARDLRTTTSSSCWRTRASRSSRRPGTTCSSRPRRSSSASPPRRAEPTLVRSRSEPAP